MANQASSSRLIEDFVQRQMLRHRAAEVDVLRLDIQIMHCELLVERAFIRAGYEARS